MQLIDLAPQHVLCVVVLANGVVEKLNLELDDDAAAEDLAVAAELLEAAYTGRTLETPV